MNETSVNHLCFHVNKTLQVLVRLKQTKIWDIMPLLFLESRALPYSKNMIILNSGLFFGNPEESFVQEKSLVESPNVKSDLKQR